MSLLNRIAANGNGKNTPAQDYANHVRNQADAPLHNAFNDSLIAELTKKIAALPLEKQQEAMIELGLA